MTMMKEKLSFLLELENIKSLNISKFFFRKKWMKCKNKYDWQLSCKVWLKSEEKFEKLEKVIGNKEYYIYKDIFKLIDSCRIVTTGPKGIIIEIDAEKIIIC